MKPINPIVEGKQSYAVAIVNLDEKNEKVEWSSINMAKTILEIPSENISSRIEC